MNQLMVYLKSNVRYWRCTDGARHLYEIIRENDPCRLYLDVEFSIVANPSVNGDELVTRLIHTISHRLFRMFGLLVSFSDVLRLTSDTKTKFSRHLIFHLREPPAAASSPRERREFFFRNNRQCGVFIKSLATELRQQSSPLWLRPAPSSTTPPVAHAPVPEDSIFICDLGVYTRNRAFRLVGSSKWGRGKPPLRLAEGENLVLTAQAGGAHPPSSATEAISNEALLENSLVVPVQMPAEAALLDVVTETEM